MTFVITHTNTQTHTQIRTYPPHTIKLMGIYIYTYLFVCVCVSVVCNQIPPVWKIVHWRKTCTKAEIATQKPSENITDQCKY